jgi:hypothetical protein
VVLLLFVAVPLQSVAFLMGGVTMSEVLLSIELLVVTAVGFGVIGIFFSAALNRTLGASVMTYVLILAITIALPLGLLTMMGFFGVIVSGTSYPVIEATLLIVLGLVACTNPVATAILTEVVLLNYGSVWFFTFTLSDGTQLPLPSPWIVYTLLYVLMTVLLVIFTVRRVRKIEAA